MCVCVCVCLCVCVCVCVCAPARSAPKRTSKLHFELWARRNYQIHQKYVKMAGLEIIHLNTVRLKWKRTVGINTSDVWQYIV